MPARPSDGRGVEFCVGVGRAEGSVVDASENPFVGFNIAGLVPDRLRGSCMD